MDHKSAYAHHIAQAIRHKKAMAQEPKEMDFGEAHPADEELDGDTDLYADSEEAPVDPKAARKERIKAILAR